MSAQTSLQRLGSAAIVLLTALAAEARSGPLGVGLFAPELGLTPYEQFDEIDRLARHLTTALGTPVVGRSYKVPRDLSADLRAERVHFALIGGFYLASMPGIVRLIAVANSGGGDAGRWSLMVAQRASLRAFSGKVLQLPNVSPGVADFVEHGLLESNISPAKVFKLASSPGLFSAIEAVRIGAAATVLAPVDTQGLQPLLPRTLRVPPPAFVLLVRDLAPEQVESLARAVGSYRGGKSLSAGFGAGDLGTYRSFAANRRRQRLPLIALAPEPLQLKRKQWLATQELTFELPALDAPNHFVAVRPP